MKKYLVKYYDENSNIKELSIEGKDEEEIYNYVKTNPSINTVIEIKPVSTV
jgi:hypothetical protein